MNRSIFTPAAALAFAALASCASGDRAATAPEPAPEMKVRDPHGPPPRRDVRDVMQAKLAHTHALLEGLALDDYEQVELNAERLLQLSRHSEWMVHDTSSYTVFSAEFRERIGSLIVEARQRDRAGTSQAYVEMISSCLACHDYLRREGLMRDLPGRVSGIAAPDPAPPDATARR